MESVGIVVVGAPTCVVPSHSCRNTVPRWCIDNEEVVVVVAGAGIASSSGVTPEVDICLICSVPVEIIGEIDGRSIGITCISTTTSVVSRTGSTIDGALHFHRSIP